MRLLWTILLVLLGLITVNPIHAQTLIYAVNCGGNTDVGDFKADAFFTGGGTWAWADARTDSVKKNPAPVEALKTLRYGNFSYVFPALVAGDAYRVRLHFVDHNTAAGARLMDVSINTKLVLDDYDIFAAVGAQYQAVIEEFDVVANDTGYVIIDFVTVKDNAMINAIEIIQAPDVYAPVYAINCGGNEAIGGFEADQYFTGGNTWAWAAAYNDSIRTDAAPIKVLKTVRYGNFNYTFPELEAGENYLVRLHFVDHNTTAGARVMDVTINDSLVLDDYDIFAVIGAQYQAVIEEFILPANAAGKLVIDFKTIKDNAMINAIEVIKAPVWAVNCGSDTRLGYFQPDANYTGGNGWSYTIFHFGYLADIWNIKKPAPADLYTTVRYGNFAYEVPGLTPGANYKVRLHFSDDWSTGGLRIMDVYINDTQVLTNYDIVAEVGKMVADVKEFTAAADAEGFITVEFVTVKDNAVISGIEIVKVSGTAVEISRPENLPAQFMVHQNYPNPFNPTTTISYHLPAAEFVTVIVYNSAGQQMQTLVQAQQNAGFHTITWDASNVASGVYFYKIIAGHATQIKKCILMK